MKLSGWGRFPVYETELVTPRDEGAVAAALAGGGVIARGNGRAYGDSALGLSRTIDLRAYNRMLAFDPDTGQLVCEAGVLLADVIATFLPRGWFPLVTPGTRFVTIGGMIAADVHGKNHHRDGSFRACVDWIDLMGPDRQVRRCSPEAEADLFAWTLGGMGLTGVVLRAAFRLRRVETAWIRQITHAAPDLNAAIALFEQSLDATYSVAWIDCLSKGAALGRSLVMLGEHACASELDPRRAAQPLVAPRKPARTVPLDAPSGLLNGLTARAFNALYYRLGRARAGVRLVDWESYFYPLDSLLEWNRIYGRRGFAQFQCVLPLAASPDGLRELLEAIGTASAGSFLAVLKRFGAQHSPISFPMEGYTLALDFPLNPRTLTLMNQLDTIALRHDGRFYLAKDSRMSAETLRRSDPRLDAFRAARVASGAMGTFRSAQAERLGL